MSVPDEGYRIRVTAPLWLCEYVFTIHVLDAPKTRADALHGVRTVIGLNPYCGFSQSAFDAKVNPKIRVFLNETELTDSSTEYRAVVGFRGILGAFDFTEATVEALVTTVARKAVRLQVFPDDLVSVLAIGNPIPLPGVFQDAIRRLYAELAKGLK